MFVHLVAALENKRLVLHNDVDIATTLSNIQQNLTRLQAENQHLKARVAQLESTTQNLLGSGKGKNQ